MDAVPFLTTLQRLGYRHTGPALSRPASRSDGQRPDRPATGKWSRWGTTLAQSDTRFMCELIEEDIATGVFTEREAIAAAVDELDLEANSFDAACTRSENCCMPTGLRSCEKNRIKNSYEKNRAKKLKCNSLQPVEG